MRKTPVLVLSAVCLAFAPACDDKKKDDAKTDAKADKAGKDDKAATDKDKKEDGKGDEKADGGW